MPVVEKIKENKITKIEKVSQSYVWFFYKLWKEKKIDLEQYNFLFFSLYNFKIDFKKSIEKVFIKNDNQKYKIAMQYIKNEFYDFFLDLEKNYYKRFWENKNFENVEDYVII